MKQLPLILQPGWWLFEWRYWRRQTPWDTQITPPEVLAFLQNAPPGRALDLGCGTGTNAITLAERGWRVSAIDFSLQAIWAARKKARRRGLRIDFRLGDVADLGRFRGPFDYVLDIGCLFGLAPPARRDYAAGVKRLLAGGGTYMLYAWLPGIRRGRLRGISREQVLELFTPELHTQRIVVGEERGFGSAWYWFTRPAANQGAGPSAGW